MVWWRSITDGEDLIRVAITGSRWASPEPCSSSSLGISASGYFSDAWQPFSPRSLLKKDCSPPSLWCTGSRFLFPLDSKLTSWNKTHSLKTCKAILWRINKSNKTHCCLYHCHSDRGEQICHYQCNISSSFPFPQWRPVLDVTIFLSYRKLL